MPYLAFNLNDGNEFIFDLVEERLTLGRNPGNEIVIDNSYISSFHAELVLQPDGSYEVSDLKSANGTFINGKRIERDFLKMGDKVRFGQLDARLRDTKLPGPARESTNPGTGVKGVRPSGKEPPTTARLVNTDRITRSTTPSSVNEKLERERIAQETKSAVDEVARLGAQIKLSEDKLAALGKEADTKASLVSSASTEIETLNKSLAELQSRSQELSGSITASEDQLKQLEDRLTEKKAQNIALEKSLAEFSDIGVRLASSNEQIQKMQAQHAAAASDLEKVNSQLERKQQVLKELDARHADISQKHEKAARAEKQLSDLTSQQEELTARIGSLAQERTAHENIIAELKEQSDKWQKSIAESQERESGLQNSLKLLHAETAKEQSRLAELQSQAAAAKTTLTDRQAGIGRVISDKEGELKTLEGRIARLREHEVDYDGKIAALKLSEEQRAGHEEKIQSLARERESKEQEIALLAERGAAQHTLLQTLSKQCAGIEESINKLQGSEEDAKLRLAVLAEQSLAQEESIASSTRAREELQATAAELERKGREIDLRKSELAAAAAKLETVQEQSIQAEKLQSEQEVVAEKLAADARALAEKLEALTAQAAAKSNLLENLTGRHDTLQNKVTQLTAEEAERRKSIVIHDERASALEKTLVAKQAELETTDLAIAQSAKTLLETQNELASARAEMDKLSRVNAEIADASDALQKLIVRKSNEENRATELEAKNASMHKQLEEARGSLATLHQSLAEEEDARQKLGGETAGHLARHAAALAATETAEQRLAEFQINIQTRESMMSAQLEELTARVADLRREEDGLANSLQANRERLQKSEAAFHDLEKKLSDKELAYSQLMHSGDKLVSMSEALSHMESREQEVSRHLHEAAEQELSTQVKLSGLNEEITREQQRLELLRRERESEEDEHRRTLEKLAQEIDEARDRLADRMKREESAQTLRLKERINEMEEKHETLRSNLSASLDEKTVIVFAGDLIKRIDLVDILIQRFSGSGANASLEQQLRTLRASLEDILAQHNIHEFTVTPGTEVDVDLRLRITIVESTAGSGRPKVVESYRLGFIYAGENGREVILRKVEVKTSSA